MLNSQSDGSAAQRRKRLVGVGVVSGVQGGQINDGNSRIEVACEEAQESSVLGTREVGLEMVSIAGGLAQGAVLRGRAVKNQLGDGGKVVVDSRREFRTGGRRRSGFLLGRSGSGGVRRDNRCGGLRAGCRSFPGRIGAAARRRLAARARLLAIAAHSKQPAVVACMSHASPPFGLRRR